MRISAKITFLAIAAGAFWGLLTPGYALAAPGTIIRDDTYSSRPAADGDSVKGLAIDEQGALALAGSVTGKDGSHNYLTIKYGPYGTLEWAREFNPSWYNVVQAVTFDNTGNVYAAGTSYNLDNPRDSYSRSYYTDYHIVKYSPSGEPLMEAVASGFKKNNEPSGIAVDGSDNFYVTGTAKTATDTYPIFYTVKFDPLGSIQWEKSDDWGAESYATGIKVAPDGNVVVTGWFKDPSTDNLSIRMLRYDASSGKTLTDVAYNSEFDDEKAWGVTVDADGNIIVAGETNANGGVALTLKFGPDGHLIWSSLYRGSEYRNRGNAVAVDREGNIYVAGKTVKDELSGDWLLLVYNGDGKLIFDKAYPLGGDAGAEGIAVDVYGNIAITGNVKMPDQPPYIKTLRLEGFIQRQGSAAAEQAARGFDFKKNIRLAQPPRPMIRKVSLVVNRGGGAGQDTPFSLMAKPALPGNFEYRFFILAASSAHHWEQITDYTQRNFIVLSPAPRNKRPSKVMVEVREKGSDLTYEARQVIDLDNIN